MSGRDEFLKNLADTNGQALVGAFPTSLNLRKMGPYPLARDVDFPDGTSGELLGTLTDLTISGLKISNVATRTERHDVTITLDGFGHSGCYDIFGLEQPKVELDTGGSLMPLSLLAVAGDQEGGEPTTITEQQYDQLNRANDQRTKLNKAPQGRALVGEYGKYNDDYNTVFQQNPVLRLFWQADGATAEMANQTSQAVANDTAVNPADQVYGTGKVTYNDNSFAQSLNLIAACNSAGFNDAACAIPKFSKGVTDSTGNSATVSKPLTPSEVYQSVNSSSSSELQAAPSETHHAVADAVSKIGLGTHSQEHIDLCTRHGFKIDDEAIARIQAIHAEGARINTPEKRVDLFQGDLSSSLPSADLTFDIIEQPDGHVSATLRFSTLPTPELEMNSGAWAGTAGETARSCIEKAQFIRGLLQDRITTVIKRSVEAFVEDETAD